MSHLDHRRRFSYKDNWTCDLDSDVARSNKDIQRIKLKPNTQLSSAGKPVTKWSEETQERSKFDRGTLNQEKHDNVTDSTSTGRPVTVDQKEEHNIDFRVTGLSHSVVKEAEHHRVQELVQKGSKIILIEKHFMPTCSRITSTIHSAKIRRR